MAKPIINQPPPIYVVSGGKGLAGDSVVQSILIQFPNNMVPVIIQPNVLTTSRVDEVIETALKTGGVIVHTMVDPEIRDMLVTACNKNNLRHFDLVGELSDYLTLLLNEQPVSKPGLYRLQHIDYFQRVEAIEFTLKHDDGQSVEKIEQAEIILTGVSRTGKTPLSVYLAMFGWKVANVPLVPGIKPPDVLFRVDPNRVFGLTISLKYLIAQRGNRMRNLGYQEQIDYINPRAVRTELDFAESVFRQGTFTVIDITNKPIESSANEILTMLTGRFGRDQWKKSGIPTKLQ